MSLALEQGFADLARDSQRVFRLAMNAMARPGSIAAIDAALAAPEPLAPAAAALALSLCDFETPVWLDPALSSEAVRDFLRFHTGAPIVAAPDKAAFAFFAGPFDFTDLSAFSLGSLEYPDRSATLIVQVRSLAAGRGWRLSGPGIDGEALLEVGPLPENFVARREALRPLFPRGLDFIFVAETRLAALPRSTRIEA